jgi:flagellar FliL protein
MKKETVTKEKVEGPRSKKNIKKWLFILFAALALVALVIVVAGQVSSRYLREPMENSARQQGQETPVRRQPYQLHGPLDFTVNLADAGQRRYLKATVTLAFTDRGLADELVRSEPKLRDLIIGVLRSKTANEVADLDGTEKLRGEIIAAINSELTGGKIAALYFTDFLIQ